MLYNKNFPNKKLTPFGHEGANGVRLVMDENYVIFHDLFCTFLSL